MDGRMTYPEAALAREQACKGGRGGLSPAPPLLGTPSRRSKVVDSQKETPLGHFWLFLAPMLATPLVLVSLGDWQDSGRLSTSFPIPVSCKRTLMNRVRRRKMSTLSSRG
jgi:hypothetical protein